MTALAQGEHLKWVKSDCSSHVTADIFSRLPQQCPLFFQKQTSGQQRDVAG